jgi:hypothetical protein
MHQVKAFGLSAGGLYFPAFTHIEQNRAVGLLAGPFSDLGWVELLHGGLRI